MTPKCPSATSCAAALVFWIALVSIKVSSTEVEVHDVEGLRFGIDSRQQGWFEFSTKKFGEMSFSGLRHQHQLYGSNFPGDGLKQSQSYVKHLGDKAVALSIHSANRATITIIAGGTIYQVSEADLQNSQHGRRHLEGTHWLSVNSGGSSLFDACTNFYATSQASRTANSESSKHAHGSLSPRESARILRPDTWENCFSSQSETHVLDIGILIDYGFYQSYGSDFEKTAEAVEVVLSLANLIYYYQLNILVRVRQAIIETEEGSYSGSCPASTDVLGVADLLHQSPTSDCGCVSIDASLDSMTDFSRSLDALSLDDLNSTNVFQSRKDFEQSGGEFRSLGHWHLLSNCYPTLCDASPCTVGVAWTGSGSFKHTVCDGSFGFNTAVSSRTYQTWLTFVHELAHNLGAVHTFQEGETTTGGIMDYGNGKYKGEYQFNELYTRSLLCSELEHVFDSNACELETDTGFINLFPTIPSDCTSLVDGTACAFEDKSFSFGTCASESCESLEVQLRITAANTSSFYRLEGAEFSPFSAYSSVLQGDLVVANPYDGCNSLSSGLIGKMALVERGGCPFLLKAAFAEAAGAIGLIVVNNEEGPPHPLGGVGLKNIAAIGISLDDGHEILSIMSTTSTVVSAAIGGFPASTKRLPITPIETLWDKYFIGWIVMLCVGTSLSALYLERKYCKGIAYSWIGRSCVPSFSKGKSVSKSLERDPNVATGREMPRERMDRSRYSQQERHHFIVVRDTVHPNKQGFPKP